MSRYSNDGWPVCPYCGMRVAPHARMHRNQKVCTTCELQQPPDLVVNIGEFHAEVHTKLMTRKALNHWLRAVALKNKEMTAKMKADAANLADKHT